MDVIKPEVYWVNDRCYRRNPSKNNYSVNTNVDLPDSNLEAEVVNGGTSSAPYEELADYSCDPDAPDEEEDNAKYVVEKIEGGFKARATNIPASFYPLIIGGKGSTKKRLETETNTKIIIPRINEKGEIVVRGSKQKDVLTALRRMDLMCLQARGKRDVTHFASFNLNVPEVMQKYEDFKGKVLRDFGSSIRGLDENIFQEAAKLHLTICVLVLLDSRERDEVSKLLASLAPEIENITNKKSHRVQLRGLEIMNDDPSEADVLYAKCVLDDDTLQKVANLVANRLISSGYCKAARSENVKLHATLMNTRWQQQARGEVTDGGYKGNRPKRESFDARKIIEKYGDFDFGTVVIREIRIVTRHTKADDGSYNSMAVLPFS
jgi:activating signal cointegrator complex subunit 1